jgi:hypothetical protein
VVKVGVVSLQARALAGIHAKCAVVNAGPSRRDEWQIRINKWQMSSHKWQISGNMWQIRINKWWTPSINGKYVVMFIKQQFQK